MQQTLRMLAITPNTQRRIARAIERARAHPVRWEQVRKITMQATKKIGLGDPITYRDKQRWGYEPLPTELVMIPVGYRCHISFEEQPAGLCRHLSVSTSTPGRLPHPDALRLIAEAFGFHGDVFETTTAWVEEYEPGQHAANFVQIEEQEVEHHARDAGAN